MSAQPDFLATLVTLYHGYRSELMTLWNIFIAVTLGIVSLAFAGKTPVSRSLKLALSVAFSVFAAGNLYSLLSAQDAILEIVYWMAENPSIGPVGTAVRAAQPSALWHMAAYHGVMDITVIATLWLARTDNTRIRAT